MQPKKPRRRNPHATRAEQEPSPSRDERLRYALEGAGDGVWDWDVSSNTVNYSERWKMMLGHQDHEVGNSLNEWKSRVHPDDLPGVLGHVKTTFASRNAAYHVEFRMRCKDGSWKWILARAMITHRDAGGRPLRVVGTHTDISAWRAAQERESATLRMIAQGAPLQDVLDTIVRSIEARSPGLLCCLYLLNETHDHLRVVSAPGLPRSYLKTIDNLPVGPKVACSGRATHTGTRVVSRSIEADPCWRPYREAARKARLAACWSEPVCDATGAVLGAFACYHRDPHTPTAGEISTILYAVQLVVLALDHDRREKALRESEERHTRALQGSTDGLWDWNMITDAVYLSPRWKEMLGFAEHELPNIRQEAFLDRLHPEDVAKVKAARQAHFKRGVPYQVEFRLKTKSGAYKWFITRGQARRDARGRLVQMTGTISDIDDRKQVEAALRESEHFSRALLDHTSALILVTDATGRFTHVNRAVVDKFGPPALTLIGRTPWETGILDPADADRTRHRFANLFRGQDNPPVEVRVSGAHGEPLIMEVRSTATRDAEGRVERVIITATDMTEHRRLEQEILRIAEEEQATIGHNLHDGIGQTLTGIFSLSKLLELELQGDARKSAARISELIEQAVGEVRRMSHGLSPVSVRHRGLVGGLKLLAETVRTDFHVPVESEIETVRMQDREHEANVFRIAQEAINNAVRHGKPRLIRIHLRRLDAARGELVVQDNGRGMELPGGPNGSGNGIGLRVMQHRAHLIGGTLQITSRPGKGVKVTCRFPCSTTSKRPRNADSS
jgi:PAS domain S-box-containing protein